MKNIFAILSKQPSHTLIMCLSAKNHLPLCYLLCRTGQWQLPEFLGYFLKDVQMNILKVLSESSSLITWGQSQDTPKQTALQCITYANFWYKFSAHWKPWKQEVLQNPQIQGVCFAAVRSSLIILQYQPQEHHPSAENRKEKGRLFSLVLAAVLVRCSPG